MLLLLISVVFLTQLFMSKWRSVCYESVAPKQFYELDKNSVEVLFLGSSQVSLGISGMELYEDYGISAYTLGSAGQPMLASYAWLKECWKTQKVSTVVLDTAALYYGPVKESRYRKILDSMKMSWNKIEAVYAHTKLHESADPFFSYIFSIAKYHSRWKSLSEEDYTINTGYEPVFRGNVLYSDRYAVDMNQMAYDNDAPEEGLVMDDEELGYLEKIRTFCEEKGIRLLLIKTPRYDWSLTKHEQTQAYADEHGLPFLDFSSLSMMDEVGLDAQRDFMDRKHLNVSGAIKLSDYLGTYLHENYELTDFRTVEGYDELNYKEYCDRREDGPLQLALDPASYLQKLKNERYDVLIETSADITEQCAPEMLQALEALGIRANINNLSGQTYVGHVAGGTCAYEGVSRQKMQYGNYLSDGVKFTLTSTYHAETIPNIRIDYKAYSFANRGMNILVYDNQNHRVVDRSTICYNAESGTMVLMKENESRSV